MPTTATPITHGLASFTTGDFLDEFKVSMSTEVSERRGTAGAIVLVKDFNPTNEYSYKGGGNPAIALGVATDTMTGLTGGVKINNKFDHTEKNNEFDDFEAAGKHWPNAAASA